MLEESIALKNGIDRAQVRRAFAHRLPLDQYFALVGSSNPPIMRREVVFPQPEGPSSEKNSPLRICKYDMIHGSHFPSAWAWELLDHVTQLYSDIRSLACPVHRWFSSPKSSCGWIQSSILVMNLLTSHRPFRFVIEVFLGRKPLVSVFDNARDQHRARAAHARYLVQLMGDKSLAFPRSLLKSAWMLISWSPVEMAIYEISGIWSSASAPG